MNSCYLSVAVWLWGWMKTVVLKNWEDLNSTPEKGMHHDLWQLHKGHSFIFTSIKDWILNEYHYEETFEQVCFIAGAIPP